MKSKTAALLAVSIILGMMLSLQYKSNKEMQATTMNMRAEDLYQQLMQVEQEKSDLAKELQALQAENLTSDATQERNELKFRAGLTAVEGSGVVVTIEDSKQPLKMGENQNLYVVHDEDILKVINELRAAGAEAIAVNEQRLIGTSEIRCAGPTVIVNGKMFSTPFQVKAIGDPKLLRSALEFRGGVVDTLKYWGINVSIETRSNLQINPYTGPSKQEYAKAIPGVPK